MLLVLLSLFVYEIDSEINDKIDLCANPACDNASEEVCGMKTEGEGVRLKLFQSECDLLRYTCNAEGKSVYRIISMDYCLIAFKPEANNVISNDKISPCSSYHCSYLTDAKEVCGNKKDGEGFRVRLFQNECQLKKYNCENKVEFSTTDLHICSGMELLENATSDNTVETANGEAKYSSIVLDNFTEIYNDPTFDVIDSSMMYDAKTKADQIEDSSTIMDNTTDIQDDPRDNVNPSMIRDANTNPDKVENIVVVRSSLIDFNNINASVEDFFAATHVFDLPVKEMNGGLLNETTRRRLIKVAKPVKVFVPWIVIPKNISDDFDHRPTLSSCYHKCPRKCPDTYAPVCGVPGIVAREPSLMFQNHCFMDVAQCKMFWENKSPTSLSSSYVESSFLFCMGDEMNGMYRFLPLIRTLQHMGRLRKKGRFHYRFKNFKFFNYMLSRTPKFMG